MIRMFSAALAVIVSTGCGSDEVLGWVSAVEAPDTIHADQPFTVTVTTTGPDGCWRKERTEAAVDGLTATITPYDVDTGGLCTQSPVDITHAVELTFREVGVGLIRVIGRDGTGEELSVVVE